MLTLTTLRSQVSHALGGSPATVRVDDDDDNATANDIVNQAGRHLYTHAWKFRVRPSVDISTAESVSYINLPSDVGEIVTARMKNGLNDSIELTSYDKLLLIRNGSISTGRQFHAAITYYDSRAVADTTVALAPRLELAPTPTGVDDISIVYRAKWAKLSADGDVATVPDFVESLLILYVRAFAQGYEEENFIQRVAEVDASPMFHRTSIQDGMVQPEYGPIDGGHISGARSGGRLPFDTIAGPSEDD